MPVVWLKIQEAELGKCAYTDMMRLEARPGFSHETYRCEEGKYDKRNVRTMHGIPREVLALIGVDHKEVPTGCSAK
jgi:hypothetical protein